MKCRNIFEHMVFYCGFVLSVLLLLSPFLSFSPFSTTLPSFSYTSFPSEREQTKPPSLQKSEPQRNKTQEEHIQEHLDSIKAFYALDAKTRVEKASLIAVTEYEEHSDGRMKAIIKKYLKKDDNIDFPFEIGDEYPSYSYYPSGENLRDKGIILSRYQTPSIFWIGTPYSGQIDSIEDVVIAIHDRSIKDKCQPSGQDQHSIVQGMPDMAIPIHYDSRLSKNFSWRV